MKIGVYGGSFNPVHNQHIKIVNELLDNNYLDKLIIVPTGNKYTKQNLISSNDRINMLNIALKKFDQKRIVVDDYECGEERRYTFETLKHIKKLYPDDEIYFVLGMDNLDEFDTWREYEYILANFKILACRRNNYNFDEVVKKYEKYKDNIILTNLKEINISSSFIRKNIDDERINEYLDEGVVRYIKENELYKKQI